MNSFFAYNKWVKKARDDALLLKRNIHHIEENTKKSYPNDELGKQLQKIKQNAINESFQPTIITTTPPSLFQQDSDVSFVTIASLFLSSQEKPGIVQKEPAPVSIQPLSPSNGISKRTPVQELDHEREKFQRTNEGVLPTDEIENNNEASLPSIPHHETEDAIVDDNDYDDSTFDSEEEDDFESDDSGSEFVPSESSSEDDEFYSEASEYSNSEDSMRSEDDMESKDSDFVVSDDCIEFENGDVYIKAGDVGLKTKQDALNARIIQQEKEIEELKTRLADLEKHKNVINKPIQTTSERFILPSLPNQSVTEQRIPLYPRDETVDDFIKTCFIIENEKFTKPNPQTKAKLLHKIFNEWFPNTRYLNKPNVFKKPEYISRYLEQHYGIQKRKTNQFRFYGIQCIKNDIYYAAKQKINEGLQKNKK